MNRLQRLAAILGLVVALVALSRALLPFEVPAGPGLFDRAARCNAPIVDVFADGGGRCKEASKRRGSSALVVVALSVVGAVAAVRILRDA